MKGIIFIGIAVLIWSIASGLVAKQFGVPALMWYPVASLLGALCIALWLGARKRLAELRPGSAHDGWRLIAAGVAMGLNNACFMSALQITSVAVALLTHYLMPLFVTLLFAPWLLKEYPSRRDIVITFMGLTGLAVILWPDMRNANLSLGALLGALSAVFFALTIVLARQLNQRGVSGETVAFYQTLAPGIGMAPVLFWYLGQGLALTAHDWAGIAYFGVGAMGIGFILFFVGVNHVHKAAHASLMSYLEPIAAILLAALFLGESITVYILVGGLLIVGSGVGLVQAEQAE